MTDKDNKGRGWFHSMRPASRISGRAISPKSIVPRVDTELLAPAFLLRLGLSPRHKVLDLKDRVRCRDCGARGRGVVSIKWAKGAT
jgi:hypothetical protein